MNIQKFPGNLLFVWHAVVGKDGVSSGHMELLQLSRPLSAEESRIFRERCDSLLGHEPLSTERFDVELEGICQRFQKEFSVDFSILQPEHAAAVVISAKKTRETPIAVHTALLEHDDGGYGGEKKRKRRGHR